MDHTATPLTGTYFVCGTHFSGILNAKGYVYNEELREFNPKFRVCGIRYPTRSSRQISWKKAAKKILSTGFEEGYLAFMSAKSFRYTSSEKVVVQATAPAMRITQRAEFAASKNPNPLSSSLAREVLKKTEQNPTFSKWANASTKQQASPLTCVFDFGDDYAVALIAKDEAYWFFKRNGRWNGQLISYGIVDLVACAKKGNSVIVLGKTGRRMVGYSLDLKTFTKNPIEISKSMEALLE